MIFPFNAPSLEVNEILIIKKIFSRLVAKAVVAESTALPDRAQSVAGAECVEVVHPTDSAV